MRRPSVRRNPGPEIIDVPFEVIDGAAPGPVIVAELVDAEVGLDKSEPPARADKTVAVAVAVTITGIAFIALLNRLSDPDPE
jgi:hypothetical protein